MPNETMTARRPFGDLAKRNIATPEQLLANQGRIPPQATDLEEVVLSHGEIQVLCKPVELIH